MHYGHVFRVNKGNQVTQGELEPVATRESLAGGGKVVSKESKAQSAPKGVWDAKDGRDRKERG